MNKPNAVPSVSVTYAQDGTSTKANALGMRPMQERAYQKRGEQYLLIKSPPASGKSRALMIAKFVVWVGGDVVKFVYGDQAIV